ncbi:MAG TPA: YihY/virulence factor BrkB family protein [Verrucomicrobiae bacterium]|nr:YihY/virulence factor BrkB family protein [Verrucomicrobiae bacterium]
MKIRTLAWLLRRSVLAAFDDNCFAIAKGAAYSALLAFFPVLASTAAILVQTRSQLVSQTLENLLAEIVPPGTESLVAQQFRVSGTRPVYLLIAAGLISLWAASGVIKSLIEGFQSAYRVPRNRSFLHHNLIAMSLVLLVGAPLIGASLLLLFGGLVERVAFHNNSLQPLAPFWQFLSRVARYTLSFTSTTLVTSLLYYFGPYRQQRWSGVWRGGVLASVGWLLATSGFGWYVRNIAHYNVMYGSVGASIALLVWMYLMAIIALVGCEFNAEYERAAWK